MTRSDAQIAREWAEGFIKHAASAQIVDADALTAARHILATTPPPTMEDVGWDDAVHAGLCAEHEVHGLVRMLYEDGEEIDCILPGMSLLMISAEELTPLPGTRVNLTPRRHAGGWEA